ncbi:hypothetical protein ACFQV2_36645 [Actinokineospora soli]|uniref:Uncharacterized protein n=1 Tax=Actinokineospora soli TaxID=1048753 RepID=A0ABW2TZE7_9PSEU
MLTRAALAAIGLLAALTPPAAADPAAPRPASPAPRSRCRPASTT